MSIHSSCPEPGCAIANTRVLLEGRSAYPDGTGELAYQFRLCTRCRMGFVHPTPSEDALAPFYTSDYAYYQDAGNRPDQEAGSLKYVLARLRYGHLTRTGWLRGAGAWAGALAEALSRKTVTYSLGIPLSLPRSARILDYGYGSGAWLQSLRLRGYSNLAGFDIAANRERGRVLAAQGIEVLDREGLARLPAGSFDCVRLEHVFEHLVEPARVLGEIRSLLKPGGLLVMTFPSIYPWLEVADLASSPFLPYLQLPIHVAHHSVESATRRLEAAGFSGVKTRITRGERFITVLARRPEDREAAA